jgi:hypothetical protein
MSEDVNVISEVYPSVFFKFLRTKERGVENSSSRWIKIMDDPLEYIVEISCDPAKDLKVKAIYEVLGYNKVLTLNELRKLPDEEYVQFDGSLYSLPEEDDIKVREGIDIQDKIVRLEEVPEFFQRDIGLLKRFLMQF